MQCCTISAERRESAQNNRTMLRSVATHLAPEHPAERMCTSRLIESARKPRLAQSHQIRAEARATAGSLKRMRTRPTVESCEETTKCHAIETASPFLSMWLPQADSAPQTTTHGLTSNQKRRVLPVTGRAPRSEVEQPANHATSMLTPCGRAWRAVPQSALPEPSSAPPPPGPRRSPGS